MKIAVLDCYNNDIGLNILFPSADYFVIEKQNLIPDYLYTKYNIKINDISLIHNDNYEYLFIICYRIIDKNIIQKCNDILENNKFIKVLYFDNDDYDQIIIDSSFYIDKIDYIFKRNKNKYKQYSQNVIPFPFIMFGHYPLIHKINEHRLYNSNEIIDRNFFVGSLFIHEDNEYKVYRNRMKMFYDINSIVYSPPFLVDYNSFLDIIHNSKYSLDLNGVGDPNKRTFEILSQGSLRIGEYNELEWPFEETFAEETIFKTKEEFFEKMEKLKNNHELYNKCLAIQNYIFIKYFNNNWLRNYILKYLK